MVFTLQATLRNGGKAVKNREKSGDLPNRNLKHFASGKRSICIELTRVFGIYYSNSMAVYQTAGSKVWCLKNIKQRNHAKNEFLPDLFALVGIANIDGTKC